MAAKNYQRWSDTESGNSVSIGVGQLPRGAYQVGGMRLHLQDINSTCTISSPAPCNNSVAKHSSRRDFATGMCEGVDSRDGNLYEKIKTILSSLEKQSFVSSYTADYIAQCLFMLVEKADFDLSAATIEEINSLLNPWVFWIARRGIPSEGRIRDIDTTVLAMGTAVPGEKTFKDPGGKVTAHVFLSDEGTGPFRVGKRSFNCGLIFGQEQRKETIINCDARSLYELIKAVNILESGKIMAEYSAWSILRDRKQGYYTLHRAFLSYSLTEEEMEEFISLVKKLADREDVQKELVKEFVEVYGAI